MGGFGWQPDERGLYRRPTWIGVAVAFTDGHTMAVELPDGGQVEMSVTSDSDDVYLPGGPLRMYRPRRLDVTVSGYGQWRAHWREWQGPQARPVAEVEAARRALPGSQGGGNG